MCKIFFTIIILFIFISHSSLAQVMFKEVYKQEANLKVYITENRFEADLVVFEVENSWEANKDGLWYYSPYRYEALKSVFFVPYKIESDLVIYITKHKVEVGWIREDKSFLLSK